MNGRLITNRLIIAVSTLLLVANAATFGLAQNSRAQTTAQAAADTLFYSVTVTRVKPGLASEYEQFLKSETLAAYKKAGGKQWATWKLAFGEAGEYWTVRPFNGGLQQLDEPNFIVKALGDVGARAWAAKRARMIVSTRSLLLVARPELGISPKTNEALKLGIGIRDSVTPGRDADYLKSLKEAIALGPKTNIKGVYVSKALFGGDFNEYYTLVLLDSFADIEKFFSSFAKAAAEAKLAPRPVGVVEHSEWTVYRYVPELSIQPAALDARNK